MRRFSLRAHCTRGRLGEGLRAGFPIENTQDSRAAAGARPAQALHIVVNPQPAGIFNGILETQKSAQSGEKYAKSGACETRGSAVYHAHINHAAATYGFYPALRGGGPDFTVQGAEELIERSVHATVPTINSDDLHVERQRRRQQIALPDLLRMR
jgi:hypothetical protein